MKKQQKSNGLTVIMSTRNIDRTYLDHIEKTSGVKNLQILATRNEGDQSMSEVYNQLSAQARYPLQAFIHDDLIFETQGWGQKIINHLTKGDYDIIGLAGVRNVMPQSGCWWQFRENMTGIVNHVNMGVKYPTVFSPEQGNKVKPVIVLDGLFIAVNTEVVTRKWDETIPGFHFYDLGFTFPCYLDGYNIGVVTDIRVTHKSQGQTNEQWETNRAIFVEKYREELPCTQVK